MKEETRLKKKKEIRRGKENVFVQIIKWLKEHDGKMPRSAVTRNLQKVSRAKMTKEELDEVHLYNKWLRSAERKVLEKYIDVPVEEIPEDYREYISQMREFGYGVKEENCFQELTDWLNKNQGRLPRKIYQKKLTKEEKYEHTLRKRWEKSEEKTILKKYLGKSLSEVPEEYREKIAILRSYGLGLTEEEVDEQVFQWLKEHNGTLPRQVIRVKNIPKKTNELTVEEHREIMLRNRWENSTYRRILQEYIGRPIEEVPEEYRKKIQILRDYGLGKEKKEHGDPYEEIIEWLKNHNGTFPRTAIQLSVKSRSKFADDKKRKVKLSKNMSEEEHYEFLLSHRWFRCEERQVFVEYQDKNIEEVPEEYRSKIQKLRELVKNKEDRKIERENETFEEFILWLEEHDNKPPRAKIYRKGKILTRYDVTAEELYENRLYARWADSTIKSVLDEYFGRPIEEVPEEYREKISILREHGMLGKNPLKRMKASVKKQIGSNSSTRKELENEILKERDEIDE